MVTTIDTSDSFVNAPFIWVEDFGIADYETVWQRQKLLVEKRLSGEIGNGILIGEHHPVITLGRGSHAENLLNPSIPTVPIERGGDVTYHGPGQIVAYPIIKLEEGQRDLHLYLRRLEQAVLDTLAQYEVEGIRNPGLTGVWISDCHNGTTSLKKVCSIGVAVKRWVTYHGLSLNVDCDLSAYDQINPCGLNSRVMANLRMDNGLSPPISEIKKTLVDYLAKIF